MLRVVQLDCAYSEARCLFIPSGDMSKIHLSAIVTHGVVVHPVGPSKATTKVEALASSDSACL